MRCPLRLISPWVGGSAPEMTFTQVDLPEPLGPSSPTTSRAPTAKLMPLSAATPPKFLRTSLSTSKGCVLPLMLQPCLPPCARREYARPGTAGASRCRAHRRSLRHAAPQANSPQRAAQHVQQPPPGLHLQALPLPSGAAKTRLPDRMPATAIQVAVALPKHCR